MRITTRGNQQRTKGERVQDKERRRKCGVFARRIFQKAERLL